jgi:glutamyl-tRNA synthetase
LHFLYIDEPPALTEADLTDKKLDLPAARTAFGQTRQFVKTVEPYDRESIGAGLFKIGEQNTSNCKAGPFLGRMRLAITGQKVSPPLFESMQAMGRERVLQRLDEALAILG